MSSIAFRFETSLRHVFAVRGSSKESSQKAKLLYHHLKTEQLLVEIPMIPPSLDAREYTTCDRLVNLLATHESKSQRDIDSHHGHLHPPYQTLRPCRSCHHRCPRFPNLSIDSSSVRCLFFDDKERFYAERHAHRLRDESKRNWVAIQPLAEDDGGLLLRKSQLSGQAGERKRRASAQQEEIKKRLTVLDGEIVGYVCYQRKGVGDDEGVRNLALPECPKGTDLDCMDVWNKKKRDLHYKWSDRVGVYVQGDPIGVSPM